MIGKRGVKRTFIDQEMTTFFKCLMRRQMRNTMINPVH